MIGRPKGYPKSGGRQKGTPNKRTLAIRQAASIASDGAIGVNDEAPLEFLVAVMRNKALDLPIRLDAAKAAAPYLHPRLNMVDARIGFANEIKRSGREMTEIEFNTLVLGLGLTEPDEAPP